MKGIEYEEVDPRTPRTSAVIVRLDGRKVGIIKPVLNGWRYFPLGQKQGGEVYGTVAEVKRDLEGDGE